MSRIHRLIFAAILSLYGVLGVTYSVVTPLFEASDELWHYPMVETLARNQFTLPVQNAAVQTAWRQEGSQPPLYYLAAALLTAGIDTSDLETVRRINPHADIGTLPPDGNANMIVHRADAKALPWGGTVLAAHIARFFSVLLGMGTVIVTYLLARELFPGQPTIHLGAMAFNAFLPMFLFISGSVNNDNASNLLGNLLTWLIVRLVKRSDAPPLRDYGVIGVVTGMGLLAKLNIGLLIPLIAFSLGIVSVRAKSWRPLIIGGAVSGALTIAIAGWWYVRNVQLYGDPTGLNVFLDIVGRRAIPASFDQLWTERYSFTQAFWGFFGGVNVAMPAPVYTVFDGIGAFGLLSAVVFLFANATRRRWMLTQWLPASVTLAWIMLTFLSYLRWTAETPASQGRLIFGALSSICVWLAVGWTWWVPKKAKAVMVGGAAAWFFTIAALAPFTVIQPAYARPEPIAFQPGAALATYQEPDGDGRISLMGADILTPEVQPDTYVLLNIDWQVEAALSRNWSLFVHLYSPDGVVIGQRDVYPGSGALATADLAAGYAWRNFVAVDVPSSAYAPMEVTVIAGWYDLVTGERLRYGADDVYTLGSVEILPRASAFDVPNPTRKQFDDQAELIGYAMSDLSPEAGEQIEVTLYWRRLRPIAQDYVVFVHIIDSATLRIYAGSDAQPAGWTAPTSTWVDGAIIEDTHTLTVDPAAPPGIYEVEIGLYIQDEAGNFNRLRVTTPDGGMATDYAYLSRIRILPHEGT